MIRLMRFALAVVACTFAVGSQSAAAQESRGSIAGLVVDSSGGALPGVTVTIRNIGTNATTVQTTNEAGHDNHRDDQQRVHDRRIEQRRVAGARRHSAAVGRDRRVQGRDGRLRRADRKPRRFSIGNLFASNRSGSGKTPRNYNRYSGGIGGPFFRNKTFFMFSYEKLQDDTIEPFTSSVPTARLRTGDFSELLANGVQIYDPSTARLVNGVVVRDPFPGNIIPANSINAVARNVLGYFPAPNQAAAADFSQRCGSIGGWRARAGGDGRA